MSDVCIEIEVQAKIHMNKPGVREQSAIRAVEAAGVDNVGSLFCRKVSRKGT